MGEAHRFFTYSIDVKAGLRKEPETTKEVLEFKDIRREGEPIHDVPDVVPGKEVKRETEEMDTREEKIDEGTKGDPVVLEEQKPAVDV